MSNKEPNWEDLVDSTEALIILKHWHPGLSSRPNVKLAREAMAQLVLDLNKKLLKDHLDRLDLKKMARPTVKERLTAIDRMN
jgi:hypothetical protein